MGLLDGILGGAVGAGLTNIVGDLIRDHGGISGIVKQFESKGLGDTVQSWVGTGSNKAVSGDQVHEALGGDTLNQLAGKLGVSSRELSSKLAELLPDAIDKATPDGVVPTGS